MKSGLGAEFLKNEQFDPTENLDILVKEIVRVCLKADIAIIPNGADEFVLSVENDPNRGSILYIKVEDGLYSIDGGENGIGTLTPMTPPQINNALGETRDHDTFIGALEYILAIHVPSKTDEIVEIMNKFRVPAEAPAPVQQGHDPRSRSPQ